MAPLPHGLYWKEGLQRGYQDVGFATLMRAVDPVHTKAVWLYLQFISSKTADVTKSHVGLPFIRNSTVRHKSFPKCALILVV